MIDGWIIAVTMVLQTRLTQFHVWECWMKVFLEKFDMWFKHLLKNQISTCRQKFFLWLWLNFKILYHVHDKILMVVWIFIIMLHDNGKQKLSMHDWYEMFISNTVLDAKLHLLLFILQWDDTILSLQSSTKAKIAIWSFALSSQTFFCIWRWWCFSISHHNESNECPFIHTNEHTHKQLSTCYMLLAHHANSLLSAISYVYFAPSNTLWREWSFKPPNCLKGK